MKMNIKSITSGLAIAAGLSFAGSAFAGGLDQPIIQPAPPAPVFTPAPVPVTGEWTGFYAGGQLGWGSVSADLDDTDVFDEDATGGLYGVHAGYLFDLGTFVLGAEIDYDRADITAEVGGEDGLGLSIDSVARAKLIAGYDAGVFLPYLTAGVARVETSGTLFTEDVSANGAFVGIGVSYRVTDNIRVGGEVLQHRFQDFNDEEDLDVNATTATARVSFQF